jgi:hypothetical protein
MVAFHRRWLALGAVGTLMLAGCAPASPASSPESSVDASVLGTPTTACPHISLLSPAGNQVNLSGTWTGEFPTTLYYVWQRGTCVWWAGGFATSETSEGFVYDGLGLFTMVFAGRISTDFRIEGTWSIVRSGPGYIDPNGGESMILEVTFVGSGEDEQPQLTLLSGGPGPTRDIYDDRWTRISEMAIPPP